MIALEWRGGHAIDRLQGHRAAELANARKGQDVGPGEMAVNLALFAFAADRAVGVDVERLRRELPFDQLAARFFAAAEIEALAALPTTILPAAFFACWTRKEALFKAWGGEGGLVPSLKRVAVPVTPDAPGGVVTPAGTAQQWELATLDPGPGFAAALALDAPAAASCFHFDWSA